VLWHWYLFHHTIPLHVSVVFFSLLSCVLADDADAMLQLQKLEQVKMEVQSWISKVNPAEPDVRSRRLAHFNFGVSIEKGANCAYGNTVVSPECLQQAGDADA
jgi:hypothetical protein